MPLRFRRLGRSIALLSALFACGDLARAQDEAGDIGRLVEVLGLEPGAIVAEVGAGDGALTVSLARHVGAGGRVFTTELGDDRLRTLRLAVSRADLSQIEVVEARATSTNLGDACCDAVVMRDVYHHFGDPAAMNASLLASLKPGGRLAIIDFGPPPGKESDTAAGRSRDGHHGVGRQTVSRELAEAGFTAIVGRALDGRRFMVVGRKP